MDLLDKSIANSLKGKGTGDYMGDIAVENKHNSEVNFVKLESRVLRLEEKHDESTRVIEKLASKVDAYHYTQLFRADRCNL